MSSPGTSPWRDTRPCWDDYFMEIAHVVAKRSTCLRRHVGAVLVSGRRILATGYNGAPRGLQHCAERGGCYRELLGVPAGERQEICRGVHAEQNAVIQCAIHGVAITGEVVLYSTTQPCVTCAKILLNAGVCRIVYAGDYPDQFALEMLGEAGVELVRWEAGGGGG
ncbi:MAG: cytidine/deoxycytidylate deaminase family protein [Armatimonadetes bacterium]|nr:cytidine/deoxycytidylate deaminase family protein [Armatimonadota bacterium]